MSFYMLKSKKFIFYMKIFFSFLRFLGVKWYFERFFDRVWMWNLKRSRLQIFCNFFLVPNFLIYKLTFSFSKQQINIFWHFYVFWTVDIEFQSFLWREVERRHQQNQFCGLARPLRPLRTFFAMLDIYFYHFYYFSL